MTVLENKVARRPVRHWHFWRSAFWTRPVMFAVPAVAALVAVPVLTWQGVETVAGARAVTDGTAEEVVGDLQGPFDAGRRQPGEDWDLVTGSGRVVDDFTVGWFGSRDLEAEPHGVTGLMYDGEVVAVRLPTGQVVDTWYSGGRGTTFWCCFALMALGLGVGLLGLARRMSRAKGGWWSVRTARVDQSRFDFASGFATATVVPGGFGLIGLTLGIPWWLVVGLPVIACAVAVPVLVRRGRSTSAGRHVAAG
jgi:hypothetical protein